MNIFNRTSRFLNNTTFGNVDDVFKSSNVYNFKSRPIGLVQKSYEYMLLHIQRNIGNVESSNDGYGTAIGELANPFYNSIVKTPWFYLDSYKNGTANYIDYIKTVCGEALSVKNINTDSSINMSTNESSVSFVSGNDAIDALANESILNRNAKTGTDTKLGLDSSNYNRETLNNAKIFNDERLKNGFGISSGLENILGINTENVSKKKTYKEIKISEVTGRIELGRNIDSILSPLKGINSPAYVSNYGNYEKLGIYEGYLNSLTDASKNAFYANAIGFNKSSKNFKNYFDSNDIIVGKEFDLKNRDIRYIFKTSEKSTTISNSNEPGLFVYAEKEDNGVVGNMSDSFNDGIRFGKYTTFSNNLSVNDLLKKTNDGFRNGSYQTIIAKYKTGSGATKTDDITQTAISRKYGMSHGRNLLKTVPTNDSYGYENPYCRVWTYHHQYHTLNDAIRPFDDSYDTDTLYSEYNFSSFTADHSDWDFENGRKRLESYGVLNKKNGLVNITPISGEGEESDNVDIKNCMFSIENLAWKDVFSTDEKSRKMFQSGGLSPDQKGPFGGRIMWFPPYGLSFGEDVSVNWNETSFIGRGENIYTYTNTTRSGYLKFKLLVDHPSIIDYWENKGKSNTSSVDEIPDPEQEILRFFAGCDVIKGKSTPVPEKEVIAHDSCVVSPDTQEIKFYVFFPNNYSGVNDDPDFAMKYLTNGLGAGKTKDSNGNIVDYKISYAKSTLSLTGDEIIIGGYEMRPGKGISIVESQTDGDSHIKDVFVGRQEVSLYVQEGDSSDKWYKGKWYYRVDNGKNKSIVNETIDKKNYIDIGSSCLNSRPGLNLVSSTFGISDIDNFYSFSDVYIALEGGEVSSVLGDLYSDVNGVVNGFIKKIGVNGKNIDHIVCRGSASYPGTAEKNEVFRLNRARTVANWLASKLSIDRNKISAIAGYNSDVDNDDDNSLINKCWRHAEVSIYVKKSASNTVQNVLTETVVKTGESEFSEKQILSTPEMILNNQQNVGSNSTSTFNDHQGNKMTESITWEDTDSGRVMKVSYPGINGLEFNSNNEPNVDSSHLSYDENGYVEKSNRSKSNDNYDVTEMHSEDYADELNDSVSTNNNGNSTRYDNESKFFSLLKKNEPFLHHKISDKVKYFDPAFHSISPEGFNARLTFLQQCTRQGPTIGSSDNYTNNNTANNLSFGRPPVCILRLGDFYYTKIIINSISYEFEPLVWDLNAEGIGVMPMICDVNIRFNFIGGSSLAGHIARLQNALSFNYYANTEVYDNRSELVNYDSDGNIDKFKPNPTTI